MGLSLVVRHHGRPDWNADEFSYELDQARIVVGRSAGADVRLPHRTVSELHATIERTQSGFSIRDERSTNGTFVNDAALVPGRGRTLVAGDVIKLGDFELKVDVSAKYAGGILPERTASLARRMLRELLGADNPGAAPPRIIVSKGPDQGVSVRLSEPPSILVIGRGEESALRLTDADTSRAHVELSRDQDGVLARDLGSKNGLVINGRNVRQRRLKHGDILKVGASELTFEDPAELALKGLDGKPDEPVTRTAQAAPRPDEAPDPAPPQEARASSKAPPLEPPMSSMERLVYALAAAILVASVAGLVWIFR